MNNQTIVVAIITLLVGGVGGYMIANNDASRNNQAYEQTVSKDTPMGMHQMPDGTMMSDTMPIGNMAGMDHGAMMVGSEREFVSGMIPHHQEAVNTASEVLERGGSNEQVRVLASEIVAAQEAEIALLKQWHLDWYGEEYVANGSYQPMMRDLSQLSGAALDRQFLEDMIPHHMGAIMMAQSVRPYIEHQEITDMADGIMETQSAEIRLMRDLITKL